MYAFVFSKSCFLIWNPCLCVKEFTFSNPYVFSPFVRKSVWKLHYSFSCFGVCMILKYADFHLNIGRAMGYNGWTDRHEYENIRVLLVPPSDLNNITLSTINYISLKLYDYSQLCKFKYLWTKLACCVKYKDYNYTYIYILCLRSVSS